MGEKALVKNTADAKQVKNAGNKEVDARERELNDIAMVMSTREGRRFLFRLVNVLCHYDSDDFNHSGSITYRNLGERNIGRLVKSDCIEASIEQYQLLEKENWEFLKGESYDRRKKRWRTNQ